MRVLILGTGGIGGYIGAKLWNAGHDVTFLARGSHLDAMRQHGLTLESPDGMIVAGGIFTDSLLNLAPFDLILCSVKSHDTREAASMCLQAVHKETMILTVQNGVENTDILSEVFGRERVLGGIALIFSTISAPGTVHHHGGTTKFKTGETNGSTSPRCAALARSFAEAAIDLEIVPDIRSVLWEKFIFICGLGGMTAYTRTTVGAILADSELYRMMQEVVHEAATVGRLRGIDPFTGIEGRADAHYRRLAPSNTSSMYYDLTHGKQLEVEALNGAVVRFARKLGITSPANEKILNTLLPFARPKNPNLKPET